METFVKEFEHLKIQLEDIERATNNFDKSKVIGHGGFGQVYKGELSHFMGRRTMVAFKRLDRKLKSGQGDPEFWKEITMLSRYKHQNLISLLGFCNVGVEMILVYEYASNSSLNRHLSNTSLTWSQRIKICLDAARGLCYLHEDKGLHQRVLHRDIKSANILLDDKWNAKVSDMGLSKIGPANQPHTALLTGVVGTFGYLDPVYMYTGLLTKESDVYSFGVVLIEVLCGRLCVEYSNGRISSLLVPEWKKTYTDKKLDAVIFKDQPLNPTSLETFSDIAYKCLHESREKRPAMSLIIEKLESALKCQVSSDLKVPEEYEKILEAAVDHSLVWRSVWELKVLLSKGLFLNEGKTWFSLNDKGQNCLLISIDQCVNSYFVNSSSRYSLHYNSRFQVGTYNTHAQPFKISVGSEFLSPGITYMMNLVFKCPDLFRKKHIGKQEYIAITYELDYEKRFAIAHIGDKREDEWLVAGLCEFSATNNHTNSGWWLDLFKKKHIRKQVNIDFQIYFEDHRYWKGGLEIEGIEFQPMENVHELEHDDQVQLDQYLKILADAVTPVIYRSIKELKLLLSRGVLLNSCKTWFYLNDKGQHCEMISMEECVISDATKFYNYTSSYNSRFPSGSLDKYTSKVRTRVAPKFLTPYITYTVNLVFKFYEDEEKDKAVEPCQINLKYELDGEFETWISYLAHKREDNWWNVELFQFNSDATTLDLEIIFKCNKGCIVVEGMEFQPLENDEHQLLENNEDKQTISDSDDTYWEQKLPNDYKDIIKLSKDGVQWTTKKELYSILCTGFPINNGEEWFFLDKNGKRSRMLSARATFINDERYLDWQSLPDSRFGEVLVVSFDRNSSKPRILSEIKYQGLSTGTPYGCYLVYKLPEHQSHVKAPVKVRYEDFASNDGNNSWYLYLVSPQTPVIVSGKVDTYNTMNKPKRNSLPHERSDGWMDIKVCEFLTDTSTGVIPRLLLNSESLVGVIILGIELRST